MIWGVAFLFFFAMFWYEHVLRKWYHAMSWQVQQRTRMCMRYSNTATAKTLNMFDPEWCFSWHWTWFMMFFLEHLRDPMDNWNILEWTLPSMWYGMARIFISFNLDVYSVFHFVTISSSLGSWINQPRLWVDSLICMYVNQETIEQCVQFCRQKRSPPTFKSRDFILNTSQYYNLNPYKSVWIAAIPNYVIQINP